VNQQGLKYGHAFFSPPFKKEFNVCHQKDYDAKEILVIDDNICHIHHATSVVLKTQD